MIKPILIASAFALSASAFAQTAPNDDIVPEPTAGATMQDHTAHEMAPPMTPGLAPTAQTDNAVATDATTTAQTDPMASDPMTTDPMAPADPVATAAATDPMASTLQPTPTMAAASGQIVQPGNDNPERDARGIAVISAAALVPAGWNGTSATAVGGPLVDTATGESVGAEDYPACSASVTDNCLQTYERGRA